LSNFLGFSSVSTMPKNIKNINIYKRSNTSIDRYIDFLENFKIDNDRNFLKIEEEKKNNLAEKLDQNSKPIITNKPNFININLDKKKDVPSYPNKKENIVNFKTINILNKKGEGKENMILSE